MEVDCETGTMVYEGGLDKRSSLDSVQQALFFSHVTGKRPAVVILTRMAGRGGLSTGSGSPAGRPGCVMRFFGGGLLVEVIYDVVSSQAWYVSPNCNDIL